MVIFNTWISKFLRTEQFYELVQGGCSTSRPPCLHSRLRGASFLGMFFSWWKAEIKKDTVFPKGLCTEPAHSLPPSLHWPNKCPDQPDAVGSGMYILCRVEPWQVWRKARVLNEHYNIPKF